MTAVPEYQKETLPAPARRGARQRLQGLPDHGLPPRLVLRNPPRLPGRRRRCARRAEARARGPHPEPRRTRGRSRRSSTTRWSSPTHGAERVANELRLQGVTRQSGGVRGVWLRHDLGDAPQASAAARAARAETHLRPHRRADRAPGAPQRRLPLPARRVLPARRTAQPGHLLLGHAQGRRQGLRPGRRRRLLLARLRQGLQLEDADHRVRPALRSRAALLRGAGRPGRRRSSPTTAANSAAGRTAIPTSCCSRWRTSSTAPPRSARRAPTASSSG